MLVGQMYSIHVILLRGKREGKERSGASEQELHLCRRPTAKHLYVTVDVLHIKVV